MSDMCSIPVLNLGCFFSLKIDSRERRREGERKRIIDEIQEYQSVASCMHAPKAGIKPNPAICSDQESNSQPFDL